MVYLRRNVQIEPLVNYWYAWIHLLSPATAALNLTRRYLPIMKSFVESPRTHAMAVADPRMRGGPFIDLPEDRAEEVGQLVQDIEAHNPQILAFTEAVVQLHQLLEEKAQGYCLEPLYQEIPPLLRGYVELYYDMNNRPAFRFFEAMLYKSPFYMRDRQVIAFSKIEQDGDRPFILSTPTLPSRNALQLPIPFDSPALDELFKMKRAPGSLKAIREALQVPEEHTEAFNSLFTTETPPAYEPYTGDHMRIRYFGHACILVETKDVSILIDPVLSYTYDSEVSRFTYDDLPDTIDYVLITHSHQDHILMETMLQIRHKVRHIIVGRNIDGAIQDPSLALLLKELNFTGVLEMRELETLDIPNGKITILPFLGEHHDLHIASKLGYHINLDGRSVLALADSCNIDPMLYERIHPMVGDVDVLFIGMECDGAPASWAYGPLFISPYTRDKDRSRRGRGSNYPEAIDIVNRFNCQQVYVYAMGQEPWLRHILDLEHDDSSNPVIQAKKLIEDCESRNILAENLFGEKEIIPQTALKTTLIT